ncbi:hypothetical protein [Amycolatopsis sp. H20-H5]|uniref:hypothetical protein n=1 Tax=Amycolatopsis sp. H20-H5 TaxID=3046309 RepID=UPI002DBFA671|nr:hypothetical protein [Amycolatopsis sp. H20-H5]MEC3975106.1 hypothetical protein [Amycolatopsis sp. H20-H5]
MLHIWLFAVAGASLFFAVPHAILAFIFDLPSHVLNLHLCITLLLGLAGWRAEMNSRRTVRLAQQREIDDLERRFWQTND